VTPLLSPLRFLAIRHGRWVRYNFVIPGVIAAAATTLVLLWPKAGPLIGDDGFLSKLQNPMAILGGFFIAALTLVTSDRSDVLQAKVGGEDPPRLRGEALSRRRFLAFLFGYLAFASFAIVAFTVIADLLGPGARVVIPNGYLQATKGVFVFGLGFIIGHVAIATLLGLYYFTERLQVSDRRVQIGAKHADPRPAD
jgi:hypothetical protein